MKSALLTLLGASCVIAASLCAVVAVSTIPGCTTVANPDGSSHRVLGFESAEAQQKATETVNSIAAYLPAPFNTVASAVGTALFAGIGVYAGKKKGESDGWDMAHKESPALGGTPAPAPKPAA